MSTQVRDHQRSHLYETEFMLRNMMKFATDNGSVIRVDGIGELTLPPEYRFGDLDSVQSYVDRVLAIEGLHGDYPNLPERITVRQRKGLGKAHYSYSRGDGEMAVPMSTWALREVVILHEIAHALAPGHKHGGPFVAAYVDLVGRVMGPEVGLLAMVTYDRAGLDMR